MSDPDDEVGFIEFIVGADNWESISIWICGVLMFAVLLGILLDGVGAEFVLYGYLIYRFIIGLEVEVR